MQVVVQMVFIIPARYLIVFHKMSLSHEECITHMITLTQKRIYAHTQRDRHTQPFFLQGPADAAETVELVSLVNKQCKAAGTLHWASKL